MHMHNLSNRDMTVNLFMNEEGSWDGEKISELMPTDFQNDILSTPLPIEGNKHDEPSWLW